MSSKQQYYGDFKKRSNKKPDHTLADLYKESKQESEETHDISTTKEKLRKHIALKTIITTIVLLALIGGGVWFFFFSTINTNNDLNEVGGNLILPDEIYYSPLTGLETNNKAVPTMATTCIMIENSPDARPQSGLNEAGVIYEAIAEGGITRFLAIFQEAKPNYVGPVRSVRMTFVELAKPYHCSIAHVGGSDNALKLIRNNAEFRDIDQFFNSSYYWRIRSRYAPHNVYTRFSMLDELNANKGYTTSEFNGFTRRKADTAPEAPATKASKITINMSSNLYSPVYNYDANTNKYLRSYVQGGVHYSMAEDGTKTQNSPDVVIAMKVSSIARSSETQYADYVTTGSGDAVVFQNGGVIEAHWSRNDINSELKFTDNNGNEIQLNRGQTWITLCPNNKTITWE